jgi:Tfp pilus assembly protein PilN
MPIPVLKLNLAPRPSLWRQKHQTLGWTAIALGSLCLIGALATWGLRANQTRKAGAQAILISREAQAAARKQDKLVEQLRSVDVTKELPRWKLAERIFTERTLPWSRLTAELERSLVPDVRLKAIQKVRGSDQRVAIKLKGEARSRDAEEKFMASLRKDDLFQQVVLERESERTGGGVDFELFLPVVSVPSPYQPFPEPEKPKGWAAATPVPVKTKASAPVQARPITISTPAQMTPAPLAPYQRPDTRPSGRPGRAFPPRSNDRRNSPEGAAGAINDGGRP